MMHNVLAHIIYQNDTDKVINELIGEGVIRQEQREEIQSELDKFFSLICETGHSDWFTDRYEIRNESDILTSDAETYRPDRLMIHGNHVVVLDYKFGKESSCYHTQVQTYMQLLHGMGYSTEGWLAYVELNKLVSVPHNN